MTQARIETFARIAAWTLAAAIAIMTLGPLDVRPTIGHPSLERLAAYVALGGAFSLAYPRHRIWVALAVMTGACGLEMGQLLVPGRDARVVDAVVKMIGAAMGVLLATGLQVSRWAATD